MQGLAGLLRAVVGAARPQVVVVEVPDHRGPRVVEHPLDDARGRVLVAAEGLEHRALALVGQGLRLAGVVLGAGRLPVTALERAREELEVRELLASGVEGPGLVDGPEVLGAQHLLQALDGRDGRARAHLGVEAERASVPGVEEPVGGRHVVVRAPHLHARGPAGRRLLRGRRDHGRAPVGTLQLVQVGLLHRGRGRVVAAVEPHEDARVGAQAAGLVRERGHGHVAVLVVPLVPLLPLVAAAPADHDQDALLVGQVEQLVRLELSLRADGVEAHLPHVAQLGAQARGVAAQHHVRAPAAAADEDAPPVHLEEPVALVRQLRGHLADPEPDLVAVGEGASRVRLQGERVQVRLSHPVRPPQARVFHVEGGRARGREAHDLLLARPQRDLLGEAHAPEAAPHRPRHGTIGGVPGLHGNAQVRHLQRRQVEGGGDRGMPQRDGTAVRDVHRAPEAHVLVGRHGVPVDPGEGEVGRLRGEDLDRERVARARLRPAGQVQLVSAEGPRHLLRVRQALAVEPDVGAIVDAVEVEGQGSAGPGRQIELRAVPPGVREGALGRHREMREVPRHGISHARQRAQVHARVRVAIRPVLDQGAHHGVGDGDAMPAVHGEARPRDRLAALGRLLRRLQCPSRVEVDAEGALGRGRGGGGKGEGSQDEDEAHGRSPHAVGAAAPPVKGHRPPSRARTRKAATPAARVKSPTAT